MPGAKVCLCMMLYGRPWQKTVGSHTGSSRRRKRICLWASLTKDWPRRCWNRHPLVDHATATLEFGAQTEFYRSKMRNCRLGQQQKLATSSEYREASNRVAEP